VLRLTCVASADAQQLVDVVHPDLLAFDHCKCTVISMASLCVCPSLTKRSWLLLQTQSSVRIRTEKGRANSSTTRRTTVSPRPFEFHSCHQSLSGFCRDTDVRNLAMAGAVARRARIPLWLYFNIVPYRKLFL